MKFWEITVKDLRILARDMRALVVLVALPLIFIAIIGLTTGQLMGWTNANRILTIAFVDQVPYDDEEQFDDPGGTKKARNLVTKIFNRLQNHEGIEVQKVTDLRTARDMYSQDDVFVALAFGPEFIQRVNELSPGDVIDPTKGPLADGLSALDVTLESDQPGSSTHSVIEGYVYGDTVVTLVPWVVCENQILRLRIRESCDELDAEIDRPPIERVLPQPVEATSDPVIYQELVPSYTVLFIFFLVNIMARSFIQEREQGTLRRLRLAPIGPPSLLSGKTIPFLIVSIVQTVLLFVFGRILFGMSWGENPWLLIPVGLCTSLSATSLGLLVATLVRTDSQVSAFANTVVIVMAGVSGCFMPRKWLPDTMRELSLATPHAWSLIAYDQILNTSTPRVEVVLESCSWLIAFALLYFVLGTWRFVRVA